MSDKALEHATKQVESAPAGLLHASVETGLPVCALCTGPNVPDDLVQATGGTILESVLKRHRSSTRGGNA